jgi:hypothetical protein
MSTFDGFLVRLLNDARSNAKRAGRVLSLSIDDLHLIYEKQQGKCALTGMPMTTIASASASDAEPSWNIAISRVNPLGGFSCDNVQLVGSVVNRMRHDLPHHVFADICRRIVNHVQTHPDTLENKGTVTFD